jgi:hypothetical protein
MYSVDDDLATIERPRFDARPDFELDPPPLACASRREGGPRLCPGCPLRSAPPGLWERTMVLPDPPPAAGPEVHTLVLPRAAAPADPADDDPGGTVHVRRPAPAATTRMTVRPRPPSRPGEAARDAAAHRREFALNMALGGIIVIGLCTIVARVAGLWS